MTRLRRSTLRRLTAIPKHKAREKIHQPVVPPAPGSRAGIHVPGIDQDEAAGLRDARRSSRSTHQEDEEDDDTSRRPQDPQERRKHFLTTSNLKRVFRHLDLGEDGYIDVEELYEAQKGLGGKLSKDEVYDIIWEVDDEMTGKLDWKQFLTTYYRSQTDESGFEPRRFYSIVEFLLMDRDCSGEISLDEAMTTLFERFGADDLATVTRRFFKAAGVVDADKEPPPGTTVNFMSYYLRVGCERPIVPSKTSLIKSWTHKVRLSEGKPLPPALTLNKAASTGLLPSLLDAERAAKSAGSVKRPALPPWSPLFADRNRSPRPGERRTSPGGSRGNPRPFTSPSSPSLLSIVGAAGMGAGPSSRPATSGLAPLQPLEATSGLAASSLEYVGRTAQQATAVKEKASNVLHVQGPAAAAIAMRAVGE